MQPPKFPIAFLIYFFPLLTIVLIFNGFDLPRPPVTTLADDFNRKVSVLISVGLIIPFVETFILIAPTKIFRKIFSNNRVAAAFTGSLIIILMHLVDGWLKVLVVSWGFFWSSYWYLWVKEYQNISRHPFACVFAFHSITNSCLLLWDYLVVAN